jgi:type IV secretion system protein VirD4
VREGWQRRAPAPNQPARAASTVRVETRATAARTSGEEGEAGAGALMSNENGSPARSEPPLAPFELVAVVVLFVAGGAAAVVFGGTWLAARVSGGSVAADPAAWLAATARLVSDPGDPARAWGANAQGLPGPGLYWACTVAVSTMVAAAGVAVGWWWRRAVRPRRVRFGVDGEARQARRRDVRPLVVGTTVPPAGRLLLGRLAPKGPLLATEDRDRDPMPGRRRARQGSRGSVALIGPTQSGKTALLSGAMATWSGPIIALSVKRDLYDVTAAARAKVGELAVFDPGGSTGMATARWTPLRGVTTASGALRAGRALAAAIPHSGVANSDYWAQQGETFVSAYLALAGLSQVLEGREGYPLEEPLGIERLKGWAFRHVGIRDPVVNRLVRMGLESEELETQLLAHEAGMTLMALDGGDARIRDAIYATARTAFQAWGEPPVAHSASRDPRDAYNSDEIWHYRPRYVDLDWLMAGPSERGNTLYLIAPDTEFKRLSPVLGGLLGDFKEQLHAWDIEGRRIPKPLLIVIDEAAQLELEWLPEEVSTIAGLGGMYVTCWQSKAQIDHRYQTLSDAVLGGHRSKVIFAGCDDPATLNWLRQVAGTEQVGRRGWSSDLGGGGRRSVSENVASEDLVGAHVARQMLPGDGVLIHGTLPPVHLRSVRWWEDHTLTRLIGAEDGRPAAPKVSTCPLSHERAQPGDARYERAALQESADHLPAPDDGSGPRGATRKTATPDAPRAAPRSASAAVVHEARKLRPGDASGAGSMRRTSRSRRAGQVGAGQLELLGTDEGVEGEVAANRHAGCCARCGRWLLPGHGRERPIGRGTRIVCHPECPPREHQP